MLTLQQIRVPTARTAALCAGSRWARSGIRGKAAVNLPLQVWRRRESLCDIERGSGRSFGGQQWLAGAASEACG